MDNISDNISDNIYLSEDATVAAIWIVFAESYVNPKVKLDFKLNKHEQSLVVLLYRYLDDVLKNEKYSKDVLLALDEISKLLKTWSNDLNLFYEIKSKINGKSSNEYSESCIRKLAQQFLTRTKTDNILILPNGLSNNSKEETVSVSILERRDNKVDWIQVDPGSGYHQVCPKLIGKKSNAYLKISNVNLKDITEDWLYLLISLKTIYVKQHDFITKNVFSYEWLLPHLNGETVCVRT